MKITAIPHGYVKTAAVPIIYPAIIAENADIKSNNRLTHLMLSKGIPLTAKNHMESRC